METREKPTGSVMGTKAVGAGASPSRLMAIRCSRAALLLSSLRRAPPTPADGPDPQEASERWRRWAVASWAALARERRERKQLERLGELEGWVILLDRTPVIEAAQSLTTQLRWDARVMELESSNTEKLLICQKPFFSRHQ